MFSLQRGTMDLHLELERPAKKSGGDRYKYFHDDKERAIYVPQSVSRYAGEIKRFLTLSVMSEMVDGWNVLCLDRRAKRSGDDRFLDKELRWLVYLPMRGSPLYYQFKYE